MNHPTRRLFRLILAAALFCGCGVAYSAELVLDDESLYGYAMHLYRNGEYYRAVTEYQRLLHFFPESTHRSEAVLQIGRSYMAGGRTDDAVAYWKRHLEVEAVDNEPLNRSRMLYGISLLDMDRALPYRLRLENVQLAMTVFKTVEPDSDDGRRVRDFVSDWSMQPEPDTKSPMLAGTFSAFLPGSGSFYTGRPREGIYAFFLTALFWLATADAISSEEPVLTGVFGFFTLAFYGGNIYTAVNSAHKYNDQLFSDELKNLRQRHGVWFVPENRRRKGRF